MIRWPKQKAKCPACGSTVLRFLGVVVESHYGPWGVRTHQIGADYACGNFACATPFRVLSDGVQRMSRLTSMSVSPDQMAKPYDPNAKPPAMPGTKSPIPILLPPRDVA